MRKLTVDEIISQIKSLAHDQTLPTNLIYTFINNALNDIQDEADYNFQVIRDETVTVNAGSKTVSTQYDVKRIIEYSPTSLELQINQGNIELSEAPNEDTEITLTYIRTIPEFDGTEGNNIFPDSDLLIFGAVYYALIYNFQPEFQKYEQLFYKKLKDFAELNEFILPMPQVENLQNICI